MSNAFGLIDFDWDAPVSNEERDALFEKIVVGIHKWRLEVPAALFLESSAPLSHIAGQSIGCLLAVYRALAAGRYPRRPALAEDFGASAKRANVD